MEFFVADMKNLPLIVEHRLLEVRKMDNESSQRLKTSAAEEAQIFEELATLAKENPDFDEGPILERFGNLINRRQETHASLEEQMKKIQRLYDAVDGRITFIDSCTKDISHLFPHGSTERGGALRKKKRKKVTMDEHDQNSDELFLDGVVAHDPNEPVYCTCRQISYGNMIACENPDCSIEWFHFGCVGLTAEPGEPWYCTQCKS